MRRQFDTRPITEVAHCATESGAINKAAAIQVVKIRSEDLKEPSKVSIRSGCESVVLNLRNLCLDEAADFQSSLYLVRQLPK